MTSPLLRLPPSRAFNGADTNIARYTKVAGSQPNPQKAIIDWIFKRTGMSDWHGDKVAVLSAGRTELRAYNSPEIFKQVDEIVERFTNATEDVLSIHVQFIAAVDTRWRYSALSRLTFVGSGPQGQQIWTTKMTEAALMLSQMQVQQGFRKLADQRVEMINGQTLSIRTFEPRGYAGGLQTRRCGRRRLSVQGRKTRGKHRPQVQPPLELRRRRSRRHDRLDDQHGPVVPSHQGHRPPRRRPRRDGGRRSRVDPDTPRPDLQELAARPDPDHFRRDSSRHPRQEGGLVQPPDSGHLSHRHRSSRLPRRRDRHSLERARPDHRDHVAPHQVLGEPIEIAQIRTRRPTTIKTRRRRSGSPVGPAELEWRTSSR